MQISNQLLCHAENCCFAQIRGLAPARGAGRRLVWEGADCKERGDSRKGRGCCWDHCRCALFDSFFCHPKSGGRGRDLLMPQKHRAFLSARPPDHWCSAHHTHLGCLNGLTDL